VDHTYFKNKAMGITVIHLRAAFREETILQRHSPMDYHLHNLIYFDRKLGHAGAVCLDTGGIQTVPCSTDDDLNDSVRRLNMTVAQLFVDRIDSMVGSRQYPDGFLFNRADQELWDIFNGIKEKTFLESLPRLAQYLNARKVAMRNDVGIKEAPDQYKWAEITLSEERVFASALA